MWRCSTSFLLLVESGVPRYLPTGTNKPWNDGDLVRSDVLSVLPHLKGESTQPDPKCWKITAEIIHVEVMGALSVSYTTHIQSLCHWLEKLFQTPISFLWVFFLSESCRMMGVLPHLTCDPSDLEDLKSKCAWNQWFNSNTFVFPRSVLLLLKNPTFIFLCLAGATEATLIAGMSTFGPKFLESQFSLSASEAATFFGKETTFLQCFANKQKSTFSWLRVETDALQFNYGLVILFSCEIGSFPISTPTPSAFPELHLVTSGGNVSLL